MKQIKSTTLINLLLILAFLLFATACTESESVINPTGDTDQEQLKKLIDEDEVIQSFEPNYNEDEAMDIANNGLAKEIYPVRVGQKMKLTNFNVSFDIKGDTAYGEVEKTFDGTLFIAASFDEFSRVDSTTVDTLIRKSFTTTVIRNVVFIKKNNNLRPEKVWKIHSISLPNGGTNSENINITKLTVILPDGSEIVVDDPNEYYLTREPGLRNQLPIISRGEKVTIRVEVKSAYSDNDFVTLTYGAIRGARYHKAKKRFELVSSERDGAFYKKVYENSWMVNRFPGVKHAIINAMPKQVIYDDATDVETNGWGIPYIVK